MAKGLVAHSEIDVNAPAERVWSALTDPAALRQFMFGSTVASSWKVGSPITFKGEWKGQAYEDKGVIQEFTPNQKLSYTHYSPLMGKPDTPENYHTVAISLSPVGSKTRVRIDQDNNDTEEAREHSAKNWTMMLEGLKKYLAEKPT
jgi:uncharacterized protein YndB with AHSA1/START domain